MELLARLKNILYERFSATLNVPKVLGDTAMIIPCSPVIGQFVDIP